MKASPAVTLSIWASVSFTVPGRFMTEDSAKTVDVVKAKHKNRIGFIGTLPIINIFY
jgi:hypothetical protein